MQLPATVVLSLLGAACHHTWPTEALAPACPTPTVATANWMELRVPSGRFTLRLPPGARDLRQICIDSECGAIDVGKWTLSYDGGPLAGGGDSLTAPDDAPRTTSCVEQIDGRRVYIRTFRFADTPRDLRWRGYFVAEATMLIQPGYPFTFGVTSQSPEPVTEFLAALRTLHINVAR